MRTHVLAAASATSLLGLAAFQAASAAQPDRLVGAWGRSDQRPFVSAAAGTTHTSGATVLRVRTETVQDRDVNLDGRGLTAGDFYIFREVVRDRTTRRRLGTDTAQCTYSFPRSGDVLCTATFTFTRRGDVSVQGVLDFAEDRTTFAITGGTGEFAGAGGEAQIVGTTQTETFFEFRVIR